MERLEFAPEELITLVRTTSERDVFLWQCEEMLKTLYAKEGSLLRFLNTHLPFEQERQLTLILKKYQVEVENTAKVLDFFISLKKILLSQQVISLSVAFALTSNDLEEVSNWFVREYKKAVMLDITVDPSLIGGAIIGDNGKVFDFSVKKYLNAQKSNSL